MSERTWLIYRHVSPSGKSYIGQTHNSVQQRWKQGYRGQKIVAAINKYGADNFEHQVLESGIKTQEQANRRERYWIRCFDSYENGYNGSIGGRDVCPNKCIKAKKKYTSKLNKTVYLFKIDGTYVTSFSSVREAGKQLSISSSEICRCCKRIADNKYTLISKKWITQYTPIFKTLCNPNFILSKTVLQLDCHTGEIICKLENKDDLIPLLNKGLIWKSIRCACNKAEKRSDINNVYKNYRWVFENSYSRWKKKYDHYKQSLVKENNKNKKDSCNKSHSKFNFVCIEEGRVYTLNEVLKKFAGYSTKDEYIYRNIMKSCDNPLKKLAWGFHWCKIPCKVLDN